MCVCVCVCVCVYLDGRSVYYVGCREQWRRFSSREGGPCRREEVRIEGLRECGRRFQSQKTPFNSIKLFDSSSSSSDSSSMNLFFFFLEREEKEKTVKSEDSETRQIFFRSLNFATVPRFCTCHVTPLFVKSQLILFY